jgi:hypothetical protein
LIRLLRAVPNRRRKLPAMKRPKATNLEPRIGLAGC